MAIRAGKLLADRLFGGSDVTMDYNKVGHRITMLYFTGLTTVIPYSVRIQSFHSLF